MNVESFEKLHGFFIEDLKVGQKAILKKKITNIGFNFKISRSHKPFKNVRIWNYQQ